MKRSALMGLWRYMLFFFMVCFVVTSSFLLFGHYLKLDEAEIRRAAPVVMANVFLLSVVCSLFEWLLHNFTVSKPIQHIRKATHRIATGDFAARIDLDGLGAFGGEYISIAKDINYMAGEIGETETLRSDFVANVSHEMKTPLSVIKNYAALLKREDLPREQALDCIEGIDESVQKLSALITNVLKLNKLEHQEAQIKAERFNLGDRLARCCLDFDEKLSAKDIELNVDINDDVTVNADKELLDLVWSNLMSNAIKFTPEGGRIDLSVKSEGNDALVTIADSGCGMDEMTGRHIFDKFYQGDSSHASEGNGLGLAMVKRAIELTGAEIRVESELGNGSAFTVILGRDE